MRRGGVKFGYGRRKIHDRSSWRFSEPRSLTAPCSSIHEICRANTRAYKTKTLCTEVGSKEERVEGFRPSA